MFCFFSSFLDHFHNLGVPQREKPNVFFVEFFVFILPQGDSLPNCLFCFFSSFLDHFRNLGVPQREKPKMLLIEFTARNSLKARFLQ